jgi:hypothetical protein
MTKYCLIAIIGISLTGCSWLTNFYIYNYSGKIIEICYLFRGSPFGDVQESYRKGFVYKILENDKIGLESTAHEFPVDTVTNSLTVKLNPNEASYFGEVTYDFDIKDVKQRELLTDNIVSLSIMTPKDTAVIQGGLIPTCFRQTKQKYQYGLFVY